MSLLEIAKKFYDGTRILKDWVGDGGEVVDHAVAQSRANICLNCPKNTDSWKAPEFIAEVIREQVALKNGLELNVQEEDKLKTCEVCLCPIATKIWVPIAYQTKYMTKENFESFPNHCWLRRELNL